MIQYLGQPLLARGPEGRLCSRIATVFPQAETIVTLPGIHATQRAAYVERIDAERVASGAPTLTESEQEALWMTAVDLVLDDEGAVLIRPDPCAMDLAFEADDLLQQAVSKTQVRFLYVRDPAVHEAIKRRGECWRMSPQPRSPEEMAGLIAGARIAIGGPAIYYYSPASGTRLLTFDAFDKLGALDDAELGRRLGEIGEYARRKNRLGNAEIRFFQCTDATLADAFPLSAGDASAAAQATGAREAFGAIRRRIAAATAPEFRRDDPDNARWRGAMYGALVGENDKSVCEEELLGLSPEFFLQIEWLPGGRIEQGEFLLDPVFDEQQTCADDQPAGGAAPNRADDPPDSPLPPPNVCDSRARELIFNFLRDKGDLRFVNIGRVADSLSRHHAYLGHRGAYIVEFQEVGHDGTTVRFIRMQKRGVWENLDAGMDLLDAMLESDRYTSEILDRRLACRQLGMNLPACLAAAALMECYAGVNPAFRGRRIRSTYFERDYLPGLASDKTPSAAFADDGFATAFARALGRAAAPNLIVGRCDAGGRVIFDEGDEIIVQDSAGLPREAAITDHTGTFAGWRRDLAELAPAYAAPIERRRGFVSDPRAFARAYVEAFAERFEQIRGDYRKRRRAFDGLFKYARPDACRDDADLPRRWAGVLQRLAEADSAELSRAISRRLAEPPPPQ